MPDFLHIDSLPSLRRPYLVAAFAGWNDAAQVATHALLTLVGTEARPFAHMEYEEFYDFTETRPTISIGPSGGRGISWPENQFYAHSLPQAEHDVVVLIGVEPQLRWKTFTAEILGLAENLGVEALITVGGLLADVPHTLEPRVSGFLQGLAELPSLADLNLQVSSYEGPTGINGVLHDAWSHTGRPAISLWGSVPHYISAAPNPQVARALLERLGIVLEAPMPTRALKLRESAFRAQVDEALARNPEAAAYVEELERSISEDVPPPPNPDLINELEEFLRRRNNREE